MKVKPYASYAYPILHREGTPKKGKHKMHEVFISIDCPNFWILTEQLKATRVHWEYQKSQLSHDHSILCFWSNLQPEYSKVHSENEKQWEKKCLNHLELQKRFLFFQIQTFKFQPLVLYAPTHPSEAKDDQFYVIAIHKHIQGKTTSVYVCGVLCML